MQIMEKVGAKNVQIIAAFIFGVIFISVILYLVFSSEDLNQNRMWVVKVILSLAAAGVAAILPGFIDLEGRLPWLNVTLVRAGGALAIFCLVFIYPIQPPTPPVEVDEYVPPTVAKDKSDNWVSLIGGRDLKGAYHLTSSFFRTKYPEAEFMGFLGPTMGSLGALIEKKQISTSFFRSPPGFDKGAYSQYIYKTKFSDYPDNVYIEVTLIGERAVEDWMVYGFRFAKKNESGMFVPLEF